MKALLLLAALPFLAAERTVDPTFLHRYMPDIGEQKADMSTSTCHYKPLFGAGDAQAKVPRSVARFGEITVDPGGHCEAVAYPVEEQAIVILDGTGALDAAGQNLALRKHDFLYLPPGVRHAMASDSGVRLVVMGFKIPGGLRAAPPTKPQVANFDDVKWQTVSGHPDSVLYQLLIGDKNSKRDKIAAGEVITSLFIMEFEPGGTNFPHHHDKAEEIYLVLDGAGDMVAGGGADGVEGRHPARAGDAYFFRLNCTVGFYAARNGPKARILAVRSLYPFSKEVD
jgi:mannose-6-phosphate isomerase-like protein (cupin superfamily)